MDESRTENGGVLIKQTVGKRGKGKIPAKSHVSLRLPPEVLTFYRRTARMRPQPVTYTSVMRSILMEFYEANR